MTTSLANPAKMIEKGAPHIIHNEAQLDAYTEALFKLTALDHPTPAQIEAIDLLTLLIERYEQEHYPIPAATPVAVVKYLLQQQSLNQRDLVPEFGSESAVSMFLSGQRQINLKQIRNLSKRFNLPADIFFDKTA
jgi:HTH-type transcriptional regulator / antitoxin HigA